jgi:hypothetical protein
MAMELQQTQRDILEDMPYLGRRSIDEQANHRYEGSDGSHDPLCLFQRHMARAALEENQADRIGTVVNGAARIFCSGDAANFNAGTHDQAIAAYRKDPRQSSGKRNRNPAFA